MNESAAHKKLRIVFMGTPEFAVSSLRALMESDFDVVGVVTAPDKPAGRGLQMQESAVKTYALSKGLNILQPEKLKNPDFLSSLKALNADIQVVVAFRMLPEVVWNMPPLGTINVHASLLPEYRGAAPINWAIINGEKYSGVTTFRLKHEIDTGDILMSSKVMIDEDETAGGLHDKLKEEGARLLVTTLKKIAAGEIQEQPQTIPSGKTLRHAPKIFTDTCLINWSLPTDEVHNLIRGLSPHPAAFTFIDNKKLKIFQATKIHGNSHEQPGTLSTDRKTYLRFATSDGFMDVKTLQLEGRKRMDVLDFIRGYHWEK